MKQKRMCIGCSVMPWVFGLNVRPNVLLGSQHANLSRERVELTACLAALEEAILCCRKGAAEGADRST